MIQGDMSLDHGHSESKISKNGGGGSRVVNIKSKDGQQQAAGGSSSNFNQLLAMSLNDSRGSAAQKQNQKGSQSKQVKMKNEKHVAIEEYKRRPKQDGGFRLSESEMKCLIVDGDEMDIQVQRTYMMSHLGNKD